jgi:hypothetical protein
MQLNDKVKVVSEGPMHDAYGFISHIKTCYRLNDEGREVEYIGVFIVPSMDAYGMELCTKFDESDLVVVESA